MSLVLPWLLRVWRQLPEPLRRLYLRLRYGHFAVGLAALIRDEGGRILLVHRTYSRDEPWALPGGWLELGDLNIERALQRELLEETGLRVKVAGVHSVERTGFAVVVLLEAALMDPTRRFGQAQRFPRSPGSSPKQSASSRDSMRVCCGMR